MRTSIQYGDDCSGARAPLEALCQLVTKLATAAKIEIYLEDKFASECPGADGDGPRAFMHAQRAPDIIFDIVHRVTSAMWNNWYTSKLGQIPKIDVYCAGWVCRDVSTMSTHRRPLLPGSHRKVVAGKASASSQTLDSSIQYITVFRPGIVLLEIMVNTKSIAIAVAALRAVGGYSTCVILTDSRSWDVCMSRRRLYLLAIQRHLLAAPLGELVSAQRHCC